jgi:hypothetical protein
MSDEPIWYNDIDELQALCNELTGKLECKTKLSKQDTRSLLEILGKFPSTLLSCKIYEDDRLKKIEAQDPERLQHLYRLLGKKEGFIECQGKHGRNFKFGPCPLSEKQKRNALLDYFSLHLKSNDALRKTLKRSRTLLHYQD